MSPYFIAKETSSERPSDLPEVTQLTSGDCKPCATPLPMCKDWEGTESRCERWIPESCLQSHSWEVSGCVSVPKACCQAVPGPTSTQVPRGQAKPQFKSWAVLCRCCPFLVSAPFHAAPPHSLQVLFSSSWLLLWHTLFSLLSVCLPLTPMPHRLPFLSSLTGACLRMKFSF